MQANLTLNWNARPISSRPFLIRRIDDENRVVYDEGGACRASIPRSERGTVDPRLVETLQAWRSQPGPPDERPAWRSLRQHLEDDDLIRCPQDLHPSWESFLLAWAIDLADSGGDRSCTQAVLARVTPDILGEMCPVLADFCIQDVSALLDPFLEEEGRVAEVALALLARLHVSLPVPRVIQVATRPWPWRDEDLPAIV
jgi:hypothetical protein